MGFFDKLLSICGITSDDTTETQEKDPLLKNGATAINYDSTEPMERDNKEQQDELEQGERNKKESHQQEELKHKQKEEELQRQKEEQERKRKEEESALQKENALKEQSKQKEELQHQEKEELKQRDEKLQSPQEREKEITEHRQQTPVTPPNRTPSPPPTYINRKTSDNNPTMLITALDLSTSKQNELHESSNTSPQSPFVTHNSHRTPINPTPPHTNLTTSPNQTDLENRSSTTTPIPDTDEKDHFPHSPAKKEDRTLSTSQFDDANPQTPPKNTANPLTQKDDLQNTPRTLAALKSLQTTSYPNLTDTNNNDDDDRHSSDSSAGSSSAGSFNSTVSLNTARQILPNIDELQLNHNIGIIAVAIPKEKIATSNRFSYAETHAARQEARGGKNRAGMAVTDFAGQKRILLNSIRTLLNQGTVLYPEWWLYAKAQASFTEAAPTEFNKTNAPFHGAFEESHVGKLSLGKINPSKTKMEFEKSYNEWERAFFNQITAKTPIGQPSMLASSEEMHQPVKIRFNEQNAPGVKDMISRLIVTLKEKEKKLDQKIHQATSSTRKISSGQTKEITEKANTTARINLLTVVQQALFSNEPTGGLTFEDWSILRVQASDNPGMPYSGALADKSVGNLFDMLFVKWQDLAFIEIRRELGLISSNSLSQTKSFISKQN